MLVTVTVEVAPQPKPQPAPQAPPAAKYLEKIQRIGVDYVTFWLRVP